MLALAPTLKAPDVAKLATAVAAPAHTSARRTLNDRRSNTPTPHRATSGPPACSDCIRARNNSEPSRAWLGERGAVAQTGKAGVSTVRGTAHALDETRYSAEAPTSLPLGLQVQERGCQLAKVVLVVLSMRRTFPAATLAFDGKRALVTRIRVSICETTFGGLGCLGSRGL